MNVFYNLLILLWILTSFYLDEPYLWELFKSQFCLLPRFVLLLPLIDPRRGDCRDPHSIPQEQNDIFSDIRVPLFL